MLVLSAVVPWAFRNAKAFQGVDQQAGEARCSLAIALGPSTSTEPLFYDKQFSSWITLFSSQKVFCDELMTNLKSSLWERHI